MLIEGNKIKTISTETIAARSSARTSIVHVTWLARAARAKAALEQITWLPPREDALTDKSDAVGKRATDADEHTGTVVELEQ